MVLSEQEKKMLLHMTPKDITAKWIIDNFSDKAVKDSNGKIKIVVSKYQPNDRINLEKGEYFNKEAIQTTVGLFIFNKLLIEEKFSEVVGYVNETVNASVQKKIDGKLAKALLEDKITTDDFVQYLNRTQWLSMQFNPILVNSFTMKTLKPDPAIMAERDKLIKQNREKLDKGDVVTAVKIEKAIQEMAKKKLDGDPGMDLYDSGARGSFGNNYKNIALMKGPVLNPTTGKWDIIESNYMEGIRKKEIPIYGNSIVTGAYPKAVATAISGYLGKQLTSAFQAITLDKKGSDCKTTMTVKILLTPSLVKDMTFRYIIDNGKIVLLTDENIKSYVGKYINLRSPKFCIGDKLCNICAGELFNKLGLKNVGLTTARVASTVSNLNMKKFHDSTASIQKIDLDNIII